MEARIVSVCTLIAAHHLLREVAPEREYPLVIDVDRGTVEDSGEDAFFLHPFPEAWRYTGRPYAVSLEWRYTEGRAGAILRYIGEALEEEPTVELWHVWLTDGWDYDDRPVVRRATVPLSELTAQDIKELDEAEIWNRPDRRNLDRPAFYCLTVAR